MDEAAGARAHATPHRHAAPPSWCQQESAALPADHLLQRLHTLERVLNGTQKLNFERTAACPFVLRPYRDDELPQAADGADELPHDAAIFEEIEKMLVDGGLVEFRERASTLESNWRTMSAKTRALQRHGAAVDKAAMLEEAAEAQCNGERDALERAQQELSTRRVELSRANILLNEATSEVASLSEAATACTENEEEESLLLQERRDLRSQSDAVEQAIKVQRAQLRDYESVLQAPVAKRAKAESLEVEEPSEELQQLRSECEELKTHMKEHDERRRTLCEEDAVLLEHTQRVDQVRAEREEVSAEDTAVKRSIETLSRCIQTLIKSCAPTNVSASALLALLVSTQPAAGEMTLAAWQAHIAATLAAKAGGDEPSSAGVKTVVYSLVASNLVRIDRTHVNNTVQCLM